MKLYELTAHEASDLLARREVSSVELTRSVLERIEAVEPQVHSFVTVTAERALADAQRADELLKAGEATPLTGVPAAIKDNISTQGIRTTCSSRMLEQFVPIYDATVTRRLAERGVVLLGKANLDEFAMGSSTEHSAFGATRNPWDTGRVPGGSSGGAAAAVAAGEAFYSIGSDTGGSVRQPASLCGVVGMKPTYGRVSRMGLVAFASSLDQIGPLTRDVEDCALVLEAIAGYDPNDSTSVDMPVPSYRSALSADLRGLRLGVPKEYFVSGIEPGVEQAIREAIEVLKARGAEIVWDVSLPYTEYALPVYYIIAPSEASANLARYDGVKYGYSAKDAAGVWDAIEQTRGAGFGPEVKRRIMIGTYALSAGYYDAYYLKAQKVRTLIRRDFEQAFERVDALIGPTSPVVAFPLGARLDDPYQMYLADVLTIPVNIAGLPAMSVPAGFSEGLPVGLQIIGKPWDEQTVLNVGFAYQQDTDWHNRRPGL